MTNPTPRPEWRRSCSAATCIEVAKVGDRFLIRDSKDPDVNLSFSEEEWTNFVRGVREGVFRF